ncbi:MAG TPA: cytochrome b N-terminal domain-containing protein [Chloroflexia bacterium]|nr:cytochrome b N-terminal domain-containing protein [Chloroflexia bacterium]
MAVFKPHIPILEDIKTKGFLPAMLFKTNEFVERFTAGLDIDDIRSVLRGDPPPRPNPRVKPHADGFWFHMRPTYYHNLVTGLYPSFRLGWLSTYFFALEIITGLILMVFYTPSPLVAYENMLNILGNVPFGRLMRDLHKLGAELMVISVLLHMARTFLTGNYKKPRQFTWATGIVLLLVTLILSFSGYLLPWDQLSLWAVTIGASMVEAIQPQQVGDVANLIVRGGPQFNAGGLLRWYLAHVLGLPLVGLIFLGVHYYKVVIHGHSLPPEAEAVGEDTAQRVPVDQRTYFMPDILTRELLYVSLLTAIVVVWAVFSFHAPLEPHADPLITPLHTTAPWYFLFLQGMLKIGDKFFWGIIVPGIITNILIALPYVEVGPSRRYGDRRVGLSVGLLTVATFAILSYMGTPWYAVSSSPDQEIVAELLPQTHPGPLRETDFAELPAGTYEAANWASAPTPALGHLLEEYENALKVASDSNACRQKNNCLVDGKGYMIIQDWQTDASGLPTLKRITFRVIWNGGPPEVCVLGQQNEYCQVAYYHQQANYWQKP